MTRPSKFLISHWRTAAVVCTMEYGTILLEAQAVPSNFVPDLRPEAPLEQLEISHLVQSSPRGEPMDEDSSVDHGGPTYSAVWRCGHTLVLREGKLALCIFIFVGQNPIQFATIPI